MFSVLCGNAQDLCNGYLEIPPDSLRLKVSVIMNNSMKAEDTCILGVIEYCKKEYIKTDKSLFLEIIDSCWKSSDGYVSDLQSVVSSDLFEDKFEGFFKYVYKNRYDTAKRGYGTIQNLFIEGIKGNGKEFSKEKVDSVLTSKKYSSSQKKYLQKIFKGIDFNDI